MHLTSPNLILAALAILFGTIVRPGIPEIVIVLAICMASLYVMRVVITGKTIVRNRSN